MTFLACLINASSVVLGAFHVFSLQYDSSTYLSSVKSQQGYISAFYNHFVKSLLSYLKNGFYDKHVLRWLFCIIIHNILIIL